VEEKIHRASFRIPKDLYKKAKLKAIEEDKTITEIIIECLKRYVEQSLNKEKDDTK